jgi:hypothetical protein
MIVVGNNTVASQMHKFQTGKRTGQRRGSHSHPSTSGRYRYQIGESDGSDRQFGAGHRLTPRLVPLRFVSPKASPAFCLGASRLRHCSRRNEPARTVHGQHMASCLWPRRRPWPHHSDAHGPGSAARGHTYCTRVLVHPEAQIFRIVENTTNL